MNVNEEIRRIYDVLRDLQDRLMDLEDEFFEDGEIDELTPAIGFEIDGSEPDEQEYRRRRT